ncbi:transcriptional regulator [Verminephrobacter aporrectodeae subsp. tuberculatae]|uniref:helix-turn-helix domain-containing protein n=1 Tax=Verminephrobacter aporrectodeae TaxID=1110389 RepID=UPI0022380B9C|nr:helix-turn-helix domain-containing protein [Verminephrobacter aporrectodeae]MCW5223501.1 transcriptional regulator [Verminephrobacter aporrectodeae subsp. tuberculatae]MCW5288965.1 transcriptional regulator [Verminephrobacter aporrectodeae subsp. tuberculatae]
MHPEQIKAAIRMQGTTPAAIADSLGVSRSMVSHVISGAAKSARIADHIARLVGKPVTVLWPPKPQTNTGLRRIKPAAARTSA